MKADIQFITTNTTKSILHAFKVYICLVDAPEQ